MICVKSYICYRIYILAGNFCSFNSLLPRARTRCFLYFPLPVFGSSSPTPSSPSQKMCCGALIRSRPELTHSLTSSSLGRLSSVPLRKHDTTSPYRGSSSPTTQHSLTPGCLSKWSSISAGEMFSPPMHFYGARRQCGIKKNENKSETARSHWNTYLE